MILVVTALVVAVAILCFSLARNTQRISDLGRDLTNAECRIFALEKKETDRW